MERKEPALISLLARLFIKPDPAREEPETRRAYGVLCGIVGICLNVLLFAGKFLAGTLSGSIAITADAFNNLSDAGSSFVTLVGFQLAGQKPDSEHPFGHGRMEYVSGLAVSVLILLMDLELGKTSIEKILHPEPVDSSPLIFAILCATERHLPSRPPCATISHNGKFRQEVFMQTKDLLDCSQDVLRAEKALEVQYEEYYEQLADQQSLSPEEQAALRSDVTQEVEMLEDASSCLRQAHQWASDKADELTTRLREGQESSQRKGLFRRAPANSVIDLEEEQADSFASGVNFYKVALICIAGSFAGVVVEILWCLFRNGYIESRSGLVYGPFNPVYGIGAVVMTLALYRYRNRSSSISFFGGAVVGSVIEYLLSWGQETLFGSTSWDYSRMPFNLDGRICLLYSLFWGILGVLWIKSLYPRVAQVILKIPNRFGKVLTWVLTIFMVFDCAMSLLAVDRWSERVRGETPVSAVDVFFDEHFPDSRMERIYANMEFGTNPA